VRVPISLAATDRTATARKFTSKQMGDACEMLVAAELTLAGIPALKVPDNWPHYAPPDQSSIARL